MVCVYAELDADDADCRGNEPIYANGELIGITTSGAWGHAVGRSLFFAYVHPDHEAPGSTFEVRVMDEARTGTVLAEPAWDPKNERLRA